MNTPSESEEVVKVDTKKIDSTATATANAPKTCEFAGVSSRLTMSGSSVAIFMYESIVSSFGSIVAFFSSSPPPPSAEGEAKSESLLIDVIVLDEKKGTMEEKVLIDAVGMDEKTPKKEKENNEEEVTPASVELPTTMIDVVGLDEKTPKKENENNEEEVTPAPVDVPTTMINVEEIDQMIKEIVTAVSTTTIDEELKI